MIRRLLVNQQNPEKTALIENNRNVTYLELIQKAKSLQSILPQKKQAIIGLFLPNGSNYIAAFWGVILSGMTVFPLNTLMTNYEIVPLLKQAGVDTVITCTQYQTFWDAISMHEGLPLTIICIDQLATYAWDCPYKEESVSATEPMVLLSTSGTTGKCKIAQLSEKNVETSVLGYLDKICLDKMNLHDTRFTLFVPFSSVYGLMILSACLMHSFPIVLPNSGFTLEALYQAVDKHGITHYEGSASIIMMMEQMAGRSIGYDIHTLKYLGFGGSKVSANTIEKIQAAYPGIQFFQGYGMTESASLIAKHPHTELKKTGSVGNAIRNVTIVIETESGITDRPYAVGEVLAKGDNVMLGYYNNQTETGRVIKNGYLYTGDIGYLDEEGYLFLCGRKKNVIIVRGFNVYPEEVEECIENSMLVNDCLVYGQTDDWENEIVCADIIPIDPHIQIVALQSHCNAHLAEYKQPQKFFICETVNKNASGKTERQK